VTVDLGDAQIGVVLGINVFDEFIAEMFSVGAFPRTFESIQDVPGFGTVLVHVALDVPRLGLGQRAAMLPRPELALTGDVELHDPADPQGPPVFSLPLDIQVFLDFVLRPEPGEAPMLGLEYGGFAGPAGSPIGADQVDALFANPAIAGPLAAVSIDVLGPVIEGAEPIVFPDEASRPARDTWSSGVTMLPGSGPADADAAGVFVALPGASAVPAVTDSPLPVRTGFGLVYARQFLDLAFALAGAAAEGTQMQGATIDSLDISMEDSAIHIDGAAHKDSADITFVGPIVPTLVPGTIVLYQDTSSVDVDIDVPWWQDMLLVFRFIPVFWPILIPAALINSDWDVWAGAAEIADAPDQVRSGLADRFASSLVALTTGLTMDAAVGDVTLEATPDHSRIENGHFMFFAQTFVSTLTEPITNAYFSKARRRFVQYELESGRLFKASELARLVAIGKIVTPGFHEVGRRFMRADPDPALSNNLEERFGLNLATGPY
jgi:hypothetical protein